MRYAIKVGSCTTFSVEIKGFLRHTTPLCMAYFGVIFFANMGRGGCRNCFHQCTMQSDSQCSEVVRDEKLLIGGFTRGCLEDLREPW